MKITQLSSLNEVQIHLVKQLIKECQMFDGTHKEPYLLNTLNFDKRMPSFFSDMKKKRLLDYYMYTQIQKMWRSAYLYTQNIEDEDMRLIYINDF